MNKEILEVIYQHPVATFFILVALASVVSAANPFRRDCDCACNKK